MMRKIQTILLLLLALTLSAAPKPVVRTTYEKICAGTSFIYKGEDCSKAGTYDDTIPAANAADPDTIDRLVVQYYPSYYINEYRQLGENDTLVWRGDSIFGSMEEERLFYRNYQNQYGCDSLYVLHVTPIRDFFFHEEVTICASDAPYRWRGQSLTKTGTYEAAYKTKYGRDSIYTLDLTVEGPSRGIAYLDMCEGDTAYYKDTFFVSPGIYYDTLHTISGCDSITNVVVTLRKSYRFTTTKTIPLGDSIMWCNKYYKTGGIYFERYTSVAGCDSVYELQLSVVPTYHYSDTVTICESELPYKWADGTVAPAAGEYPHTYKTVNKFDSTVVHVLKVHPEYVVPEYQEICRGEVINWHGITITDPGIYYDSLKTANGCNCDSVVMLTVNYKQSYLFEEYKSITNGSTYEWHGHVYDKEGLYYDSLTTKKGCDSVYMLVLQFKPLLYIDSSKVTICQSEAPYVPVPNPFKDYPNGFLESGLYKDTLIHTAEGVTDTTVYLLRLTVNPTKYQVMSHDFCQNEGFTLNGTKYTTRAEVVENLSTVDGCDSVVMHVLIPHSNYLIVKDTFLVPGRTFQWHGMDITKAGSYYDPYQTQHGCDSVYELNVHMAEAYFFPEKDIVCESELPYVWRDKHIMESGVYYDSLHTIQGADSVYQLTLTVKKAYHVNEHYDICEGESFTYDGRTYTESTSWDKELRTFDGCDSIVHVSITMHPAFHFVEKASICEGESYVWTDHNQTLTATGVYYDNKKTIWGCNLTYELQLTVHKGFRQTDKVTICSSELPYQWHGKFYDAAGTYEDKNYSINGCDSTYTLELTVKEAYYQTKNLVICEGETMQYRLGNKTISLTESMQFDDSLISKVTGCDSIIHVIVNKIAARVVDEGVISGCDNAPTEWRGLTLTKTGEYEVGEKNENGCDTVIYKVQYVVYPSFKEVTNALVCNLPDSLPYIWAYNNQEYYVANDYYVRHDSKHNCDSIYQLHLVLTDKFSEVDTLYMCPGGHITLHGKTFNQVGNHSLRLPSVANSQELDSIYRFYIKEAVRYEDVPDTVTICASELPYRYNNKTLYTQGDYRFALSTSHGCDSIVHLHLIVKPTKQSEEKVLLCAGETFQYTRGDGTVVNYSQPGIYYENSTSLDGCDSVHKIVVERVASYYYHKTDSIKEGGTYLFHSNGKDTILTKGGTYFDHCQTIYGCDSIYRLDLVEHKSFYHYEEKALCANSSELPYTWRGQECAQQGFYYDSLITKHGMDSVYCLYLVVKDVPMSYQQLELCAGEAFELEDGRVVSENGVYDVVKAAANGCDSIVRYVINFGQTHHMHYWATIKEGESYPFRGENYIASGTYVVSEDNPDGCPAIYELHLTVNPVFYVRVDTTICYDALPYRDQSTNKLYYESTTYVDSLKTVAQGLDSIVTINLTVREQIPMTVVNIHLCEGDVAEFTIGGVKHSVSEAGIYDDVQVTRFGCDSVVRHVVTKSQSYHLIENKSICQEGEFRWRGHYDALGNERIITKSGTYFDSLVSIAGCDSVHELRLRLRDGAQVYQDTTVLICRDELQYQPRDHHNRVLDFSQSDIVEVLDSFISISGCDSIRRFTYQVTSRCSDVAEVYFCESDKAVLHGDVITQPGLYRYQEYSRRPFVDADGHVTIVPHLDSVYRAIVSFRPTYHYYDTVSVCAGETYLWHGRSLTNIGDYVYTDQTYEYGCDSILHLHLKHYPTYRFAAGSLGTIPDYGSIYWASENQQISAMGLTPDAVNQVDVQYPTIHGCDSVIWATIYVVGTRHNTIVKHICTTELPYHFSEVNPLSTMVAYMEGMYNDTIFDANAHVSIINTYDLRVDGTTTSVTVKSGDVCLDPAYGTTHPSTFPLEVTYTGEKPTDYLISFDQQGRLQGFEDQEGAFTGDPIEVVVPAGRDANSEGHPRWYAMPGNYNCYLTVYNGVCGAQQTVTVPFELKYPSWIMEQHFYMRAGAISALMPEYNGGYAFSSYEWEINGAKQSQLQLNDSYVYREDWKEGDEVVLYTTRGNDPMKIASCPYIVHIDFSQYRPAVLTVAMVNHTIARIHASQCGSYVLYGPTGQLINRGVYAEGETMVELPSLAGCYIMHLTSADGEKTVEKLVVY